jgi:NDP-hexose-3-ketoreductase
MGKHILVEKPIVLNRFELDYVADLANRSNLIIKQNFMFEYHSQFKFIQREIKNGRIGELRSVKSSFGFPPFKDNENIRYNLSLGGGALNDAGAYGIKMSTLLLDFTDNFSVFSGLNIDKVRNVDLFGSAYLIDKNGVHAHIDFGFDNFYQCELTIWGSKGRISANRIFTAGPGVQPKIIIETNDEEEVIKFESENHFIKIIEQLYYDIIAENFDLEVKRNLEFVQLLEEIRDKAVINYIC